MNKHFGEWKSSNQAGFTLLELLVAVTLIAVMAVGVWAALSLCIRAWTRGIEAIDINQRDRTTQDLVRRQIASAYPLLPSTASLTASSGTQGSILPVSTSSVPVFSGGETSLRFVSPNSLLAMDSAGLILVTYEVEVDSDGNIALVQREAPYTGQSIDDGGFTSSVLVFYNLKECIFEYYDSGDGNNPAEWLTEWDTASRRRLPAAMRMSILFHDGDRDMPGMQMIVPLHAQYNYLQTQQPFEQFIQRRQQRQKPKTATGF